MLLPAYKINVAVELRYIMLKYSGCYDLHPKDLSEHQILYASRLFNSTEIEKKNLPYQESCMNLLIKITKHNDIENILIKLNSSSSYPFGTSYISNQKYTQYIL
jgi:hypothetical protein